MDETTDGKNCAMPFDLHGDLEDAYDKVEREGRTEVTETLDTFGIWQERPKCNEAFLHKIWRALQGDAEAQSDVGHAFYWTDHDPEETRQEYKWLDKPELAIYWYELAAEAGLGVAQVDLGCLYCPDLLPYSDLRPPLVGTGRRAEASRRSARPRSLSPVREVQLLQPRRRAR